MTMRILSRNWGNNLSYSISSCRQCSFSDSMSAVLVLKPKLLLIQNSDAIASAIIMTIISDRFFSTNLVQKIIKLANLDVLFTLI